jgi:hypothetical protein
MRLDVTMVIRTLTLQPGNTRRSGVPGSSLAPTGVEAVSPPRLALTGRLTGDAHDGD